MMRILVVHNQLWAHYKSKLFEEIYTSLSEKAPDASFRVIQIGLYESGRRSMQPPDAGMYHYPYQVLFEKSLDEIRFPDRVKALFRAYSGFKPTILNITGYYDWAQILLMCYARICGVKVVLSSESSAYDHTRNPLKERIKRWIVGRAHAFFSFGTTSAEYLETLGVPGERITVRNAAVIDDTRVREQYLLAKEAVESPRPAFIFVGRLSPEKNLPVLLEAYAEARKLHPAPWDLIVVGDGPVKAEIEEYLVKEKADGITLTGGVSWLKVPEWLAKARVLVLPSYSEPWGLVVNEALVCGLPVIVSEKCGCAPDLVRNGENGYTFDPGDTAELTRHLLHFMNTSPDEMKSYSRAGQAIVSRFAADKVAGEMVNTFIALTGDTRKK